VATSAATQSRITRLTRVVGDVGSSAIESLPLPAAILRGVTTFSLTPRRAATTISLPARKNQARIPFAPS
jgi:hypothetical protein